MSRLSGMSWIFALAMVAVPVSVCAAELGNAEGGIRYGFSTGALYSNNPGRNSTDDKSETSYRAGVFSAMQYDRDRLSGVLNADLQFETHSYGNYTDTLVGGVVAGGSYKLFRDQVVWVVEDNFGQALIESRNTLTPENSQDVNIFATGPDIFVPLGSHTHIQLQGRWTDVYYQTSNFGNHRISGTVGLGRQLGEHNTITLAGSNVSVKYSDLPSTSDYEIRTAYVAWGAAGGRTNVDLTAGYSTLVEEEGSTGSYIVGVGLIRKLSARSALLVYGGRGFGDSADIMKRDQGIRGASIGDRPAATSSDPLRADYASVSWHFEAARNSMDLTGEWRHEEHSRVEDLTRRMLGAKLELTHRISQRFAVRVYGEYTDENYVNADTDFYEWGSGIGLRWNFTSAVSITSSWDRLGARGDTTLGPGTRDFVESRVTLGLTWERER